MLDTISAEQRRGDQAEAGLQPGRQRPSADDDQADTPCRGRTRRPGRGWPASSWLGDGPCRPAPRSARRRPLGRRRGRWTSAVGADRAAGTGTTSPDEDGEGGDQDRHAGPEERGRHEHQRQRPAAASRPARVARWGPISTTNPAGNAASQAQLGRVAQRAPATAPHQGAGVPAYEDGQPRSKARTWLVRSGCASGHGRRLRR